MNLQPIPTDKRALQATWEHWSPFLPHISRRSKEPVESLIDRVFSKEVQVVLAWDAQANKAIALAGLRYFKRGDDLIGEIVWCTGRNRTEWQHLVAEIERYLKDMHCVECRPICRPGWSKILKQRGYKTTHFVMEKPL